MEEDCLQELSKPNPIQKRVPVPPRSINPLLPLPNFQHSEDLIDLATPFSAKSQKKQLIFQQTQFSKLFSQPIYQSNPRFDTKASNLNFACLKSFYSESGIHVAPAPSKEDNEIAFESRFQSGNLAFAAPNTRQKEYNLLLQKDINSTRCTQWFFFRVHNKQLKGKLRLNILNFFKSYSSYDNGMKILVCSESNSYTWTRGCEEIVYRKTNIKVKGQKYYYSLSFSFDFEITNDVTYFAHSAPYTFSMLDQLLLDISNNEENRTICKRKTLAESPGGNYVDMLTITNFQKKKEKKIVFITSRVHPGQTPASFVCQGVIKYLLSSTSEALQLRDHFIFKIVPMLNPDGVINGSYRCSLSGYDLNRVWHCDNKISSPQIYYTKRAILDYEGCFLFIDLHAHSKKKGVFMYGCQNRASPYLSRHIPYLFWKQIPHFNYYQCNFSMNVGRQGTSRLNVHRSLNLHLSYTMEHSFCGPIKDKYHFHEKHYKAIGRGICQTLKKYYCCRQEPQILKQLYQNKELLHMGGDDADSSEDSDLDEPEMFAEQINQQIKRRFNSNPKPVISNLNIDSAQFKTAIKKDPKRITFTNDGLKSFFSRNIPQPTRKLKDFIPQIFTMNVRQRERSLVGEEVMVKNLSQSQSGVVIIEKQKFQMSARMPQRYEINEADDMNNLFLPSITSASYKRYGKKKNYPKQFIQVGRDYLESQGLLKDEIRSVSRRKTNGWRGRANSYL